MTFLLPIGLLALLALPLIVVLHMLRERRRRVVVPSLLNWLQLPRRNQGQKLRRLPLTLLLLLHLLVAGLLGLALGRPQLLGGLSGRASQTAIVLDTSTSMAARQGGTTRFAQAQERARAVLRSLGPGDRATLVAAAPAARIVASGGPEQAAAMIAALDGLRPGGTAARLDEALTLAEASLEPARAARIVVLTDGAATPIDSRAVAAPVEWQQIGWDAPNRAIIAFAARPTGGKVQVYARVANYDNAPFASTLQLYGDDQRLDSRTIRIEPNAEYEQTWTLPAGATALRAELDSGDALPEDDQAYLSLETNRPLNVLLVTSNAEPLGRALAAVPGVTVAAIDPASYPSAAEARRQAHLTVFDSFLPDAWPEGAALAINPPADNSLIAVNGRSDDVTGQDLTQRGATVAGLSFGGVNFGAVALVAPPPWAETLLAAEGAPLVLRGRDGERELAVWTFDIGAGNLPTRLAFPLLVARTVRDLAPAALPASALAGAPIELRPDSRSAEVEIVAPSGQSARLDAAPSLTVDTLVEPGWHRLTERGANGALFEGRLAINAGSALESDLRPLATPSLSAAPPATIDPAAVRSRLELWPWLAAAALALLFVEWGYVHFRRTA